MLHGRLLRVSELVVVLGAVVEQQRVADLGRELHHAESAALAGATRAAMLDTRRSGARGIDLGTVGKLASFDGQASGLRNIRFQFTAYCGAADAYMRREMEEATWSEVPTLTGPMRREEADRSRRLLHRLVLSCAAGAMEVMENVPGGGVRGLQEATSRVRSSIARKMRRDVV